MEAGRFGSVLRGTLPGVDVGRAAAGGDLSRTALCGVLEAVVQRHIATACPGSFPGHQSDQLLLFRR
jgi:hypothetical protein